MTVAADLLLVNGEVHTLTDPDEVHEAVAVRDGEIVAVGSTYELDFLRGVETRVVDLDGCVLLPGFVDAHTHLPMVGRALVHADLSGATGPDDCVSRLRDRRDELVDAGGVGGDRGDGDGGDTDAGDDWVLGFGYDESTWSENRYLTRTDLDAVSESRPVAAFREDMHVASLNGVALSRLRAEMPDGDVRTKDGTPTGVVVEEAVDAVWAAVEPDEAETRRLVEAAQRAAVERGVTGVHDMVRQSHAPRVYRDLERAGDLRLRVRINYWSDHLDALVETGLRTGDGSELVEVGAIKTYTDGSFGGRTAKLSEPYADWPGEAGETSGDGDATDASGTDDSGDPTGQWVVAPDELDSLVARADAAGFQVSAHAIGDAAVDAVLDAFAACPAPDERRHRVEHAELADDDAIERFADLGVVASVQPNFLKWAGEGGLYDARLGDRRRETNRYATMREAGVHLAFGSDCMPLDPLLGVHHAVNAPTDEQRLDVIDALRAYTLGGAYAAHAEDRRGTVEAGNCADLVALADPPWEHSDSIDDCRVALTVVDGRVVYDGGVT